ncbi:hypothetical protein GCG54_00014031, partial [Colletotrichum gloeosporioides]
IPFSLTNIPIIFQNIINIILYKYINIYIVIYLNNILIFSPILKKYKEDIHYIL